MQRSVRKKKRESRVKQGMMVGEEDIERRVERERGWYHRGAFSL